MTPPATAPIGPATRRPVPAPAPAPTQSARAAGTAVTAAAAHTAVANRSFFICSSPDSTCRLHRATQHGNPARRAKNPISSWQSSGGFWAAKHLGVYSFAHDHPAIDFGDRVDAGQRHGDVELVADDLDGAGNAR